MKTDGILQVGRECVMNTYGRLPIALVKGEGSRVWDSEGKCYLDFVTGLAVTSLGHAHPEIVEVIREQAGLILHSSNLYWIEPQVELARRLTEHSFADKAFFCNSGAEANEGALKLARKYAKKRFGEYKTKIVSLRHSFHGRTLATLTATGQDKYHKGYEPLPADFTYVERGNEAMLAQVVDERTAALFIEPIQGEGGVHPVGPEFLEKAREICDKTGALLIFDEVQCGMGRSGKLFTHQWYSAEPDILTLAKALGNGVPIGAILAKNDVAEAFAPGDHASTFGGNFLSAAVGCKVMDIMTREGFLEEVRDKSSSFREGLQAVAAANGLNGEVRGLGFMLGLPAGERAVSIVAKCREAGLLINCVGGETLRFLPPLTVTQDELDEALRIFTSVLHA